MYLPKARNGRDGAGAARSDLAATPAPRQPAVTDLLSPPAPRRGVHSILSAINKADYRALEEQWQDLVQNKDGQLIQELGGWRKKSEFFRHFTDAEHSHGLAGYSGKLIGLPVWRALPKLTPFIESESDRCTSLHHLGAQLGPLWAAQFLRQRRDETLAAYAERVRSTYEAEQEKAERLAQQTREGESLVKELARRLYGKYPIELNERIASY